LAGRRWLALASLSLVVASVLCSGCRPAPGGSRTTATPEPTIPITQEAAQRLQLKIDESAGKEFRLQVTEEEATSYVALNLGASLPLSAPQVRFRPGVIWLEGVLTSPVHAPVRLAATVTLSDGRPTIEFYEATLAGVSVPRFLLSSVSASLSDMLSDYQGAVELQAIEITTGSATIAGRSR
jgi:hypothetical protein